MRDDAFIGLYIGLWEVLDSDNTLWVLKENGKSSPSSFHSAQLTLYLFNAFWFHVTLCGFFREKESFCLKKI
jgi:hypothetical protein